MSTTLAKWGNATGLRLPSQIIKKAHLHAGDKVDLKLLDTGEILISPVQHKPSLEDLLAGITKKNCHPEAEWDSKRGNEAW